MNCDEASLLFPEDWNETLTASELASLNAHLAECAACRQASERLRKLWCDLGAVSFDEPSAGVRARFYDSLSTYNEVALAEKSPRAARLPNPSTGRRMQMTGWGWTAAVAAAALIAGLGIGFSIRGGNPSGVSSGGTEIAGLRSEINSLRQLVALSLLQKDSASDRLRGVTFANQVERSDPHMPAALLESVNRDPSVNVRLAAADALRTFSLSAEDRVKIVDAISHQTAPLVQITLIDLVADLKDAAAVARLQAITADQTYHASVRERARWALEKLQ